MTRFGPQSPTPVGARRRRALPATLGALAAIALSLLPATGGQAQEKDVKECATRDKKGKIDLVKRPPVSPCRLTIEPNDGLGQHAWFWMSNEKISFCTETGTTDTPSPVDPEFPASACTTPGLTGQPPANPPGTTSPISNGHVGVAMKEGGPDMRAYFEFPTGIFPPGATFSKFELTLLVSHPDPEHTQFHADDSRVRNQTKAPATANQNDAAMRACVVTGGFPQGASGDPPVSTTVFRIQPEKGEDGREEVEVETVQNEPTYDCSGFAGGKVADDGSVWTFDLAAIANRWSSGEILNNGIAIEPVINGIDPTWTVEFHGGVTTVVEVPPGSEDEETVVLVSKSQAASVSVEWFGGIEPPPPPPPIPSDTGPTFPSFGTTPSDEPPPVPQPLPEPPVTAPPVATGQPVAANPKTSGWVWALLPLGALGLGLVTTAIGEDPTASAIGAGNRVAGVLRGRRLAGLGVPEEVAE